MSRFSGFLNPVATKGSATKFYAAPKTKLSIAAAIRPILFTQSYAAPGFYEKLGYRKFFTLDNCPPGFEQQGFMKQLAA